jgi:transposase
VANAWGFAMAAAIGVRGDYDAARLRELAKRSDDANQTRRLLALAAIYDGGSRTEAARIGGVGLQTVRDWVLAFNAEGPPGLVNGKAPGNRPLLTQAHRQRCCRSSRAARSRRFTAWCAGG